MDMGRWVQELVSAFPQLVSEGYEVVGNPAEQYNCIAYAAGETSRWRDHNENHHWAPLREPFQHHGELETVFLGLEFQPCNDSR